MNKKIFSLTVMVLVAAFSRLIPHPWNFTAVGAMALLGGAYFPSKAQSLVIPLAALFISDLVLGFHSTMLYVYGAFVLIGMMGWALHERRSVLKLATFSLLTSSLFFLVTNLGVWTTDALYPKTAAGLMACYAAGIPFFNNQILGDLFFTAVLFGAFELVKRTLAISDLGQPAPSRVSSR